ncbi:RNB domain-containing ribonuclease [Thiobacter aerophilum]|uniref:RNB domain-containing ribonuclease n=1 Tax=Thiobacter aerophilum TaxID=3121275 RepID=A0ABV0EID0_9BURK
MYAFYFEDGHFRVGTILADNGSSLQVEAQHGKRAKVKAADVLFKFQEPGLTGFMEAAQKFAEEMDLEFLWEAAGSEEFDYQTLARDYFGHEPTPMERAAILLRLHGAPMYFYRKGRGRYKPAPPDALKAALAAEARKRQQAAQLARWVEALTAFRLPEEFAHDLPRLIYTPDKNALETKALEQAAAATHLSVLHLLEKCGAIPSSRDYHLNRFLREWFPQGRDFPPLPPVPVPDELPLASVAAFSIDDETTTEIDDALSLEKLSDGRVRVGIHIACPALGVLPGSALDSIARTRLSTVYMPGDKITMLPDQAVAAYTLQEGAACPALSTYFTVTPDYTITDVAMRVERVSIAANLRHELLEPLFNLGTIGQQADYRYREELEWLWHFAEHLEEKRGVKDTKRSLVPEYTFRVEGETVRILHRERGTPVDKVVAEMMILVNSHAGRLAAEAGIPALYRAQTNGKTRMTSEPLPHQGLGVSHYTWVSSPLRRYVDLVNQRQLLAHLRGETPPYQARDEALQSVLRDFEAAYEAYNEFQRNMERYWTLRYLLQEGIGDASATVIRENLVRFDTLPLVTKVAALPELAPGTRVRVGIRSVDLLTLEVACCFLEVLLGP